MARRKHTILTNPLINNDGSIVAKPCTISDLTMLYGVSNKTMNSWLTPYKKQIGVHQSYIYTIKQVETIFEKIGKPMQFDFENIKNVA